MSEIFDYFYRQHQTFEAVTVECSRCERQAVLNALQPTAWGVICERCLSSMPRVEYRALLAANAELTNRMKSHA